MINTRINNDVGTIMKTCPKCESMHEKSGTFCSRSCANSRTNRTNESKLKTSLALRGRKINTGARKEYDKDAWRVKVQNTYKEKLKGREFDDLGHSKKRQRVFEEQEFSCNKCKNSMWLDKPIPLELEHKDGNKRNNSRENLEGLCPNCHAQTSTYKIGNNKNPGKIIYSEADIIDALQKNESAYAAMKYLGMNPHGGNYVRLRNIVRKNNISLSYSF